MNHVRSRQAIALIALFMTALLAGGCGGGSDDSRPMSTPVQKIEVAPFTFEVPDVWMVLAGDGERAARAQIEATTRRMIAQFDDSEEAAQSFQGLQTFKAISMPLDSGWLMAYTAKIPPQVDYLDRMEVEQEQKIAWGMEQGLVTRVVEAARIKVDGAEAIKIDTEMLEGARSIAFYFWSPAAPDRVGTISIVVNPGSYEYVKPALDAFMASLKVQK